MEIRPIRAGEAESFLRLLCDVFGLDFGRAHRIFFTEPMFDLNRKWALLEGDEILSILTNVSLEFGWGKAIGIAGVATRIDRQNEGLASKLLEAVLAQAEKDGETGALLFAKAPTLYERAGFQVMDQVIRGPIDRASERSEIRGPRSDISNPKSVNPEPRAQSPEPFKILDFQQVQDRYDHWSLQNPNRLRRNDRRWGYWRWNLRVCTEFEDGYICSEAGLVRECVVSHPVDSWPLPAGAEWLGLESLANEIGVPLKTKDHELHLMTRNVPSCPQMFMTDQF